MSFRVWTIAVIGVATSFLVVRSALTPHIEGDTVVLVQGFDAFLQCVVHRSHSCPQVSHFPPFQYILAGLLKLAGLRMERVFNGLALLNAFSVIGLFLVAGVAFRGRQLPACWALFGLFLLASPFGWFAGGTFGEPAAAFVTLFLAVAVARRANWLALAALAFLAGITKETAPPFLLLLALTAAIPAKGRGSLRRSLAGPLTATTVGAFAAVAANAALNIFRFSSPLNVVLLDPGFMVPSWSTQASFFLGLFFSPNAGMVFFCPVLFIMLAWIGFSRVRAGVPARDLVSGLIPLLGIAATLLCLALGFSKWYAPFGWAAFGPRLCLPWLPALAFVLLDKYPEEAGQFARVTTQSPARLIGSMAFGWIAVTPFVSVIFNSGVLAEWFGPTPDCPRPAIIQQDSAFYYHCMRSRIWDTDRLILRSLFRAAVTGRAAWVSAPAALLTAFCILAMRRSAVIGCSRKGQ